MRGASGNGRIRPVGDGSGDGRVAARDEVGPDGHEGLVEGGAFYTSFRVSTAYSR